MKGREYRLLAIVQCDYIPTHKDEQNTGHHSGIRPFIDKQPITMCSGVSPCIQQTYLIHNKTDYHSGTVELLLYDHHQNHIGVVV